MHLAAHIRISSFGWIAPLWQDAGQTSARLWDSNLYWKEELAWTFCRTQKTVEQRIRAARRGEPWNLQDTPNALPEYYGPVSWLAAWEEENAGMVEKLTQHEKGHLLLFFAEEFYPNVSFWRTRCGFDQMSLDLYEGLFVSWPSAQLAPTEARTFHGNEQFYAEIEWHLYPDLRRLIRMQWLREFWNWEKGLEVSRLPGMNFESQDTELHSSTSDS